MNRRTKKLFSLLLSLALVVGMIPAFGVTANAKEPTTILKVVWNLNYSITIMTDNNAEERIYGFGFFGEEDDIRYISTWPRSEDLVFNGGMATIPAERVKSILAHLDESGSYYAGVWFGNQPENTRVASSSKWITINHLPAPQNLRWEGTVAKWDPVDGASGYYLRVYNEERYIKSLDTKEAEYDMSSLISVPPAHTYRFDIETLGSSFDKADSEIIKGPEKLFETMPDNDGAEIADRVLVNVEEPTFIYFNQNAVQ